MDSFLQLLGSKIPLWTYGDEYVLLRREGTIYRHSLRTDALTTMGNEAYGLLGLSEEIGKTYVSTQSGEKSFLRLLHRTLYDAL